MATQFDPIAKDESLNTTESPSRNIADVLAEELSAIEQAISGGSGSGGHTIVNASGTDMTQRAKMQFVDAGVTDDSANDKTKVEILQTISAESDLTSAPDGVYQGTWDESVSDVLTADMVGMGDGTGDTVKDRLDPGSVSVTADGVKTWSTLLNGLFTLADQTKITKDSCVTIGTEYHRLTDLRGANIDYAFAALNGQSVMVVRLKLKASDSKYEIALPNYSDVSNSVATNGIVLRLYY